MFIRLFRRLQRRLSRKKPVAKRPVAPDWAKMSARQAFSRIYRRQHWGGGMPFNSGRGSHDPDIVGPYVKAVQNWRQDRGPMDALDLGCGDFNVGRQLRPLFQGYTACDVVPALIAHHQTSTDALDVDFRVVDLAQDPLPPADAIFIRQVLQHLPNALIAPLIPKLAAYRWLILTEHLPLDPNFMPNLDKPIGPDIRLKQNSGIDLGAPPFELTFLESQVLCEVAQLGGRIRTIAYRLR